MSIIEKAAKRLEEMSRAGVQVAWQSAGLTEAEVREITRSGAPAPAASVQEPLTRVVNKAPQPARSRYIEIDVGRLSAAGYLTPGQSRSVLADEFRGIKRPLLKHVHGETSLPAHRSNLILVTSAVPGEGKTFCAVNLAMSIASEVDTSVLLVDCDVIRPAVLSRLGVEGQHPGLLDLLTRKDLEVADTMLRTNVPKLSLLPSGLPRANATELLASASMDQLLDDLSQRYADRVIIVDAPPLLVTTEARVLASRMGQILVVVDQINSKPKEVAQAFAVLDNMPIVMSVLNRTQHKPGASRYEYYET